MTIILMGMAGFNIVIVNYRLIMDAIRLTSLFASQCNDKIHWFLYTGNNPGDYGWPYPNTKCNCGQTKWKDFDRLKHREGEDVQIIEEILYYKWCLCDVERGYPEYIYIDANSFTDGIPCAVKMVYCKVEKWQRNGPDGMRMEGIRTVPVRREEMEKI